MNPFSHCNAFGFDVFTGAKEDLVSLSLPQNEGGSGAKLVVTMNLDHVVTLQRDMRFRQAYRSAWKRTVDGTPVYLYLRLCGKKVAERVTGADLFPLFMNRMTPEEHRPFFVCSSKDTARELTSYLVEKRGFQRSLVGTSVPPFGFHLDEKYSRSLADRISIHGTTHLFFGVGAPKSEIWTLEHADELGDCYVFAFGAGLDFFAGTAKRAPAVMQDLGLEWLWRVAAEPNRLFKRYFVYSWRFLGIAVKDRISGGRPFTIH